jgi:nucleoside-diphosphate-sugar epimerase
MRERTVFFTGATSTIGSLLVPILKEQGDTVRALGRSPMENVQGLAWSPLDLAEHAAQLPQYEAATLIHTASLWLLPGWLEKFHARGVRRVIAFSSTSRFSKQVSTSPYELELVNQLASAEDHLIAQCERLGMAWTIFRPTLIYGGAGSDRNVADIARLIRKLGFFPLFGKGSGRRQPVHARDLAVACVLSLSAPATYNKAYNLSGGETLAYIDMVRRIFETLGRQPRFVRIPMPVFRLAVKLARLHPRFDHLTPDMALRMQTDLVFDHSDATRDFGYRPGRFDPVYLNAVP